MKTRLLWGGLLALIVIACESPSADPVIPVDSPNLTKGGNPTAFLLHSGLTAKGAQPVELGAGFGFTEGPAVDHFGNIYFSDQPNDRIYRWDRSSGAITLFLEGTGRANGMAFDQDGYLITASDLHGELRRYDMDGNYTVLVDNYGGNLLNGPNDLWIAPNGGIYFSDPYFVRGYWDPTDPRLGSSQQGGEFYYYLSPDGQTLTRVAGVVGATGSWPNGLVGTPDGKKLYVGQMLPFPAQVYSYDINPDGTLSNQSLFVEVLQPNGSDSFLDGMTMDAQGNVYVADGFTGISVYNPAGDRILHVPTGGWTANVNFGGPNRKTLFITQSDKVWGLDMHVRGVK
jgi:gluconolactonase